jgi:rhodanese-related sulfurtransferase
MIAFLMGLPVITPQKLNERLKNGPVFVADVNAESRWLEARVPGARHLDPVAFTDKDLPADRAATVVFYCSNPLCRKAPNAARRAKHLGYSNVLVMSAGIAGWIGAALPTESGTPVTS